MQRLMMRILASVVVLLPAMAFAQAKMAMSKLADDVYFMKNSSGSSNSVFFITGDGVLVFDFDIRTADQTLAAIRKLTDKKVRYLISSHSAGDHATGAWHFREDKPVYIATKNQAKDLFMQEAKEFEERKNSKDPGNEAYRRGELVRPDIAIDGPATLYFGGLTFQITPEGRGHSTGDLTVFVPQRRLMLMGDLLDTEIHPGQGESAGVWYSNVNGWVAILDHVMERNLPAETYVPGHGPVHMARGVKDLEEQKRYFVVMRDEVAKMVAAGKTLDQIEKEFKIPAEFANYTRPERLKSFYKLFYNQLIEKGY
ncbi:MAG TPA: MBL fold metallo-hydrolase [Candidatus Binatia bacterium]|jgi:glyoxylase-like metal-dependent hydrolase (beta-lactamase superfamily II)